MADPFYMLMLMENLGPEYIVWDKAASIRFRRPGRSRVTAQFRIAEPQIADLVTQLQNVDKVEPSFMVEIKDDSADIVAVIEKVIQVKRKRR
jgi:hypothetical protein